jgi:hypothetical protein
MATAVERRDPGAFGAQVDDQIAQATARIRAHDLAFGGLVLAAVVLAYAAGMILLDQALVLPEWVRQLGLAGFALAAAAVGYLTLVRPLLRRVNPLYAAVQVERTIEDPKNTVSGYVEARDRADVPDAVRAAMGARAAAAAGEADLNRAVDHRSLLYAGGAAVALLLTLIVLFFVFRPTQFTSLLTRAFVPFSSDPIATRTRIDLTDPPGGDVTVTAGQSVTVRVHVGGKVPGPGAPDRLRVRLRHTPDGDYEDLPLEQAESSRDWQVRVPETLIRNGVWYKVAGGDAETPEYRVTVRSVPKFTDFEVAYEFPAYVRRPPAASTDAHLEGYRGTKVTLIGKTNRTVTDGRLTFDPPTRDPVAGVPVPGRPDALRFEFTLTDPGGYRLGFTSDEGERAPESPPFGIRIIEDFAPQVEVVEPKEDEVPLPTNGHLEVDGRVGDDFGIDTVTLRLRLVEPVQKPLAPKPYQGGRSFRREADGTWPKSLEVKDSVDFTKLADANGLPVELKADTVLEYWLEATDNRTRPGPTGPEPDPNVGRSKPKRVRLTPPPADPDRQEKQQAQKEKRRQEEQQFQKEQQRKLDNEDRNPEKAEGQNRPHDQDTKKDNDPDQKKEAEPKQKEGGTEAAPKQGGDAAPPEKGDEPPAPKNAGEQGAEQGKPGEPKAGDTPPTDGGQQGQPGGQEKPPEAPPPMSKEDRDLQKRADEIQRKLDEQANRGGEAKPNPAAADEPKPPAEPKPQPKDGDPDAAEKSEPKEGQPGAGNAAESKPQGNAPKPDDPAAPKPEPKAGEPGNQGGSPMAESKPQPQPQGSPPTGDKPTPQPKQDPGMPPPKDGQNSPSVGGEAKPQSGRPEPKAGGDPKQDPAGGAGQPKPMPKAESGDKPPADPNGGGTQQPQPGAKPETGGVAKPQTGPPPADAKPAPKDEAPMPGGGTEQAGEPKPGPPDADPMKGAGAETKSKPKPQPKDGAGNTAQGKPPAGDPGRDKPAPGDNRTAQGQPQPKGADQGAKGGKPQEPTPEQKQEFEQAVQDLNSPDPKAQQAARDKLDKTVGKENRQQIEDIAKGTNSDDPKERAAAQQKLEDLKNKAEQMAGKNGNAGQAEPKGADQPPKGTDPKGGTAGNQKPDPKEVEQALKDLNSPDAKTREAAKQKLDQQLGKGAVQEAEQLAKDLQSDDKDRRAAAEQKLKEMQNQAGQMANKGGGEPKKGEPAGGKKPDPAAVDKAIDDLNSPDAKTREAAKQTLDEQLGKGTGEEAERATKDAQSGDFDKQGPARKKLDDLRDRAEQLAKGGDPKGKGQPLTPEEQAELANKLQDLNSKDDARRRAAEEEFDRKLGRENREKLQDALTDPKTADDLRKQLEEMAKRGPAGDEPDTPRGGPGSPTVPLNPEAVADAKARARSAELQLEQFERNRDNKELLDQLGMSDQDYAEFLERFRQNAATLKKEADDLEKATPPAPPAEVRNLGSGGKVDRRSGPAAGQAGVGSAGAAPPDARDALRKFREGAAKVAPKK